MTNKTYTTYTNLKKFVRSWDFANPRWENLPKGFPDCDTSALTQKQDKHLYEAIKTEWIIESDGRKTFYKTAVKRTVLGLAIVAATVLLGRNMATGTETGFARNVSAKTVSDAVGEAIQATMSAVFK